MLELLSGWIGMACIVLCWIPQTLETLRNRQCKVNRAFLLLTTVGACSLAIHAVFLQDLPFIILNGVATIGSGINLFYAFYRKAS
jgi:MtN3 and saliva related transmembrane protein